MNEVGRPREFDIDDVISKGIEFFRMNGYTQGSLTNLLEYLNISRQSLYNTFGNKRQFFIRCLTSYRQNSYDRIISKLDGNGADKEVLWEVLNAIIHRLVKEPEKNCLIMKSTMELGIGNENIAKQIQTHREALAHGLKNIFLNEKKSNGWNDVDMQTAIDMGISIIYGLHLMARGGADTRSMLNSIKGYYSFLNFKLNKR